MTTSVAKAPQGRAPAVLAIPEPSRALERALDDAASPHADVGMMPVPVHVKVEAERQLAILAPMQAVATGPDWRRFLLPLCVLAKAPVAFKRSVETPEKLGPDQLDAASAHMAFALHDMPASLLTVQRQRELILAHTFFPDAHQVDAVLRPHERRLSERVRNLERVRDAGDGRRPVVLAPEERAAIGAQMRDLVQGMKASIRQRAQEERGHGAEDEDERARRLHETYMARLQRAADAGNDKAAEELHRRASAREAAERARRRQDEADEA